MTIIKFTVETRSHLLFMHCILSKYLLIATILTFNACDHKNSSGKKTIGKKYFVSNSGNDENPGTSDRPWHTIAKLNSVDLNGGDTVSFESDQTFDGTLQLDSTDSGDEGNPIVITSTGNGKAVISAANFSAVVISAARNVRVEDLHLRGSGRKDGNTQSGIVIQGNSQAIKVHNLEVDGFQKSGVMVYNASDIVIENVHAHDNGGAGITVAGNSSKSDNRNIMIRHCLAENNPGDPTVLDNHSGNGIIVGLCTSVTIEYCAATNNGWDMPRIGNGPVGIWAYEADSVIIQNCISYRNKTSKGGEDGGGFDLDGGVTNSIIQYCLSYENEGGGFGIFQYKGASPWRNNTVRFNISENDGRVSRAHAGIFVWNGSDDATQFTDFHCYNNVIYNSDGNAIYFDEHSARQKFNYYNNIFVAKDNLIRGQSINDTFLGNNWWSLSGGFNMNGQKNFKEWANRTGNEKQAGIIWGMNIDPRFENLTMPSVIDPHQLRSYTKYRTFSDSPLRSRGLSLANLGIDVGSIDFNQNTFPANGIGASF
jgi:nitrous oxidase accessory protein NosD